MRLFLVSFLLLGPRAIAFPSYQQELIPVIREVKAAPHPSVSEWKTFVRMATFDGTPYVSLVQVAELLNGDLRWFPVSKKVDLSVHNQTIRFAYDAPDVWINGQSHRMEKPPVKNNDGFWIPVGFFASPGFFRATRSKLEWPPAPDVKPIAKTSSPAVAGGDDRARDV